MHESREKYIWKNTLEMTYVYDATHQDSKARQNMMEINAQNQLTL